MARDLGKTKGHRETFKMVGSHRFTPVAFVAHFDAFVVSMLTLNIMNTIKTCRPLYQLI